MTVKTEANKYSFYVNSASSATTGAQLAFIGSITSLSLVRTRKFDGQNTGTHLGLFAHGGHGDSALGPAIFSNIKLSGERA
jgi:hypothetical protein